MKHLDKAFLDIDNNFPFYTWLIPLNGNEEKFKFFKNPLYNPQFKYFIDPKILKQLENKLEKISIPETTTGNFYLKLKQEYLKKIKLIKNIGEPDKFTLYSKDIYGNFTLKDIEFANKILNTFSDNSFIETVDAVKIKKELEKEIKDNNIKNWNVVMHENIASKVTIKPMENTVYVKSDYKFFPAEVDRLKVHEISVHLFRAANGEFQEYEIFKRGFAGYLEAEEGLAVYFENMKGLCDSQQMKIYAGRLKAVELALNNSFSSTYETLRKWFPEEIAYRLSARAKRGIADTSIAGALTKDIHYITGYRKVKKLLDSKNVIRELFTGKIGLDDIADINKLLNEGKIKEPLHVP